MNPKELKDLEPAALAEAVRVVLAALVALGWITLDDPTLTAVTTAVAAVASVLLTVLVRRKVVPATKVETSPTIQ